MTNLPGGNATKLGIVLAARQVVESLVVVAGGVLADRLPRSVVLVGASLLQGFAQAGTAGYVLAGGSSIAISVSFIASHNPYATLEVSSLVPSLPPQ